MSDPKRQIVAGNVYIRPLAALDSDEAAEWTNLGLAEAGAFDPISTSGGDVSDLLAGHPWAQPAPFGGKSCRAAGMQERVWDDDVVRRIYTPCLLDPDHGGDRHQGVAGWWLETGDPRGIVTVWLEPAAEEDAEDEAAFAQHDAEVADGTLRTVSHQEARERLDLPAEEKA
jgi:hypothetical protein